MTQTEIVDNILHELTLAKHKHQYFPSDYVKMVAIMAEEAGEAIQVANDLEYATTYDERKLLKECLIKELSHTAAMCIRTIENL